MSEIRKFYDEDAAEYMGKRYSGDTGEYRDNVHHRLLNRFLSGQPPGSRILEVGCGTGRFTRTMLSRSHDITAIDFARNMLTEARQATSDSEGEVHLYQADAQVLPFRDSTFDAGVMINVASHLPRAGEVLTEIGRVTRADSQLFVNFPNLFSPYLPLGLYINARERSVQEDVYTHWYTPREIREVLAQGGFVVEKKYGGMAAPRRDVPVLNTLIKSLDRLARRTPMRHLGTAQYCFAVKERNRG